MCQCTLCLRKSDEPNPCPIRHKGSTLRFANKTECMGCRNYGNGPLNHRTKAEIREGLKKPGQRDSYLECVQKFEQTFDQDESRRMSDADGELLVPAWLRVEDTIERGYKKQVSVFWPRSVLLRENVEFAEKDLVEWDGDAEKGLHRDSKFGSPSGASQIFERRSKTLKFGKELGSTMDGSSAQDVNEKWVAAQGRLGKLKLEAHSEAPGVMGVSVEKDEAGVLDWDNMLPSFGVQGEEVKQTDDEEEEVPPARKKRKVVKAKGKAKCV